MPRIDPSRLLLCLKSLLNLQTGGIKTDKDVDKVFVLMTKYSKKLVSKCTYINILTATTPEVLNVFMDRGGWEMLHNWTVEAKNSKNHDLLNEILNLLLVTPASVDRLRANSLPKEVKQISNKWDVINTKTLAEKVVTKWITIARSEDSAPQQQQQQVGVAQPSSVNLNSNIASVGFGMQNMVHLSNDESGLNASNLTDNNVFENEGQSNPIDMDVDYINNVDFNEMMDFNPELFAKTIDQHYGESNPTETDRMNHTIPASSGTNSQNQTSANVTGVADITLQPPQFITLNTQNHNNLQPEQSPATTTVATMPVPVVSSSPSIPRIVIKTSGGQRSVVIQQQQGSPQVAQVAVPQPVDNVNKERVCFVTHNGQRFLMQLQVADNEMMDKLNACSLSMVTGPSGGVMTSPATVLQSQQLGLPPVAVPQLTQDQQVTSSVASVSPEAISSTSAPLPAPEQQKRKRPRKDPSITAMKNQTDSNSTSANPPGIKSAPKVLKTYSKKASVVVVDTTQSPATSTLSAPSPAPDTTKPGVSKNVPTTTATTVTGKSSPKSSSSKSSSPSASSTSSSSSSKRSSSTSTKRSSSKSSAAAAAAAAEAEKAEKLKQKTKEAKRKMKERIEDKKLEKKKSDEDKQKQKDDQTLKEIYGASTSQTLKIPKKPKPSFTDLIGVPGATEEPKKEKITKEKNDKSGKDGKDSKEKEDGNNSEHKDDELTDVTGFGAFARPETKELGPAKERRHQVKVYVSAKSKNMDLLETMTKGAKLKTKLDDGRDGKVENSKVEKSSNSGGLSFEDAISGASTSSSRGTTKRPSIDSASKNGDTKKLKIDDSLSSSDTKTKDKSSKDKKGKDEKKGKEVGATKKTQVIQESSLFMDTLNATREPAKTKRRRRISSSTDSKEKDTNSNLSTNNTSSTLVGERENVENKTQVLPNPSQDIVKPVMNFYRDTLNDSDDDSANNTSSTGTSSVGESNLVSTVADIGAGNGVTNATKQVDVGDIVDDFAPEEWEGKLKSCLCIHRPKGKAKKIVRWREEEELKEFHFFEMDETERVNVTKQVKNFSEMKLMERSEEKLTTSNWKQKEFGVGNQPEERFPWCKPRPIDFNQSVTPEVNSSEKQIQEERERSILEVFYFPGTMLPDCPSEVDVINMEIDANNIPTMIPADDVPILTKMYDFRSKPWPRPMIGSNSATKNSNNLAMQSSTVVQNIIPNQTPMPVIDPNHAFPNVFNPAAQQAGVGSVDAFNPWVQTFNQATVPQVSDPWKVAQDVSAFPGFQQAGNVPPVNAFQPLQAFGFPFPSAPPVSIPQLQQPHLLQSQPVPGPGNFGAFGIPSAQQFDPNQAPMGREDSGPSRQPHQTQPPQNQGGQGGRGSRDVDYRDIRRNDRERDRDDRDRNRDRDRSGRGDRGRDRDFRDRGRDRGDRYDNDRDYRSHDRDRGAYKRPAGGRRATPCNYFAKGYCREGNKCSFLHPGVNGPPLDNSLTNSNHHSRKPSSPPSTAGNYYENNRRRSPPLANKELPINFQGSPPNNSNTSSSMDSHPSHRREIPEIQSPTPEVEIFDAPPSSPNENHSFPRTEQVKVIPTFTEEDWA